MSKEIPGTVDIDGRVFFHVEVIDGERFRTIVDQALAGAPGVPMPKDGGAIEEKARIFLDGGQILLAISYKGDLAGWKRTLVAYCKDKGRVWGIAADGKLVLSDGRELPMKSCKVVFDA